VYIIELALKLSPFPLSVQRKNLKDAESVVRDLRRRLESNNSNLIELSCDTVVDKKIIVLSDQIAAIQIYEKESAQGGNKKPGFSFDE